MDLFLAPHLWADGLRSSYLSAMEAEAERSARAIHTDPLDADLFFSYLMG